MNPSGDVRKTVEIGGYQVVRKIGQGAMGVVYLARHLKLETEVALKLLDQDQMRKESQRARFLQEAQLAARIDHPNVVRVYNAGSEGNHCYIAMEYVEGVSLSDMIERDGPLGPAELVRLIIPVAHALAAAHARGIVHRDVKPGNILIGSDGAVKVTDFGLAREVDGDQNITQAGAVMGSPAYMSPEQARGEKVGPQTDVFSLGITLYACLVGQSPFYRANAMTSLVAVMREDVPPLVEKRKDVPPPLAKLIEQMAAKDATRRPAGMEVVAASLELIAGGMAAKAAPAAAKAASAAAAAKAAPAAAKVTPAGGAKPALAPARVTPAAGAKAAPAPAPSHVASGERKTLRPASGERPAQRPASGERAAIAARGVRAAPTPKDLARTAPATPAKPTGRPAADATPAKPVRPRAPASRAAPVPDEDDPNQPIRVRKRMGMSFDVSFPSWLLPALGMLMFGVGIWAVTRVLRPIKPIVMDDEGKGSFVAFTPTQIRQPAADRTYQRKIDFAGQVVPPMIQARKYAEAWNALSDLRNTEGWPPDAAERAKAMLVDLQRGIEGPLLGPLGELEDRAKQARTPAAVDAVRAEIERAQDYAIPPIAEHRARLLRELDQRIYESALEQYSRGLAVGRRLDSAWRYIELVESGRFDALRETFADDPRADLLERFATIENAWRTDLVARSEGNAWTALMLEDGEEVKVRFIKDRDSGDVVERQGKVEKTRFSELARRLTVPPLAKVNSALDSLEGKPHEGDRELAAGVYLRHHELPGAVEHFKAARAALERDADKRQLAAMDRYLKEWPDVLRAMAK